MKWGGKLCRTSRIRVGGLQPLREVTLIVVEGRAGGQEGGVARPFGFENKKKLKAAQSFSPIMVIWKL